MRYCIVILLMFNLGGYANFYQQNGEPEVYSIVEEMPQFPGGTKEMMLYIQKNVVYPVEAKEAGHIGKVYVKFIVDSLGAIKKPEVVKSSGHSSLDKEALRVVSGMPKWEPGKQSGKNVNVLFNLPINFYLDNSKTQNQWYNEGVKAYQAGDYKLALTSYDKALEMKGDDIDALYNAGAAAIKLNDTTRACEYWKKVNANGRKDANELLNKYCGMSIPKDTNEVFTVVEKMPQFPSGREEMLKFIHKNTVTPKIDGSKNDLKSIVYVLFVIEKNGTITESKIARSSGNEKMDNEALRVINSMPKWIPGAQNGKLCRVLMSLPIKFELK